MNENYSERTRAMVDFLTNERKGIECKGINYCKQFELGLKLMGKRWNSGDEYLSIEILSVATYFSNGTYTEHIKGEHRRPRFFGWFDVLGSTLQCLDDKHLRLSTTIENCILPTREKFVIGGEEVDWGYVLANLVISVDTRALLLETDRETDSYTVFISKGVYRIYKVISTSIFECVDGGITVTADLEEVPLSDLIHQTKPQIGKSVAFKPKNTVADITFLDLPDLVNLLKATKFRAMKDNPRSILPKMSVNYAVMLKKLSSLLDNDRPLEPIDLLRKEFHNSLKESGCDLTFIHPVLLKLFVEISNHLDGYLSANRISLSDLTTFHKYFTSKTNEGRFLEWQ